MFLMTSNPVYKRDVTVHIPNEAGDFDAYTFKAHFRLVMDFDELVQLQPLPEREVLAGKNAVLVGWEGMLSSGGGELPFSEENRGLLCKIPQALRATSRVFWESIWKEVQEEPAKN